MTAHTSIRQIGLQLLLTILVLISITVVLALWVKEPMEQGAQWLVEVFGYYGFALGIFLADAFTIPLPPDAFILLAVVSDISPIIVTFLFGTASVLAGSVAYSIGPHISRLPILRKPIERFRPRGQELFERFGVWSVLIAALTPVPFSLVCYLAGTYKMNFRSFFYATLGRIPRFGLYFYLVLAGWQ